MVTYKTAHKQPDYPVTESTIPEMVTQKVVTQYGKNAMSQMFLGG